MLHLYMIPTTRVRLTAADGGDVFLPWRSVSADSGF